MKKKANEKAAGRGKAVKTKSKGMDWEAQQKKIPDRLLPDLRSGDLVLVLGAGSIHEVGAALVRALSGREEAPTVQ